jgi:hypothetical protein
MLAAEKARRLAREGYRTLLVCFNQRLATTLLRELADTEAPGGLEVTTFHRLCERLGQAAGVLSARPTPIPQGWWDETLPTALQDAIDALPSERFPQPRAIPILAWLDDCVELCGTPLELMSDNGTPFVVWMPGVLTLFGKTLEELHIRHLRTQVNSPWTNGKIERFWGILQSELLDREVFRTLDAAGDGLARFAAYYNYDRLHGELDWHTPAERFDGTPFTARGFERVPSLYHLQGWLDELMSA